jgi:uncharacterized protein (TIGR02444 family)
MSTTFWNFSLAVYGDAKVRDGCLALQDRFGLDVNLVLLCAYLGAVHGASLTRDDINSARERVRAWQEDVVGALRAARRKLKTFEADQDVGLAKAAKGLRAQVMAAELESERVEQQILGQWATLQIAGRAAGNARDAVVANLAALFSAYDLGPERLTVANATPNLIAAVLRQI